jgi:hypothetical protein
MRHMDFPPTPTAQRLCWALESGQGPPFLQCVCTRSCFQIGGCMLPMMSAKSVEICICLDYNIACDVIHRIAFIRGFWPLSDLF